MGSATVTQQVSIPRISAQHDRSAFTLRPAPNAHHRMQTIAAARNNKVALPTGVQNPPKKIKSAKLESSTQHEK